MLSPVINREVLNGTSIDLRNSSLESRAVILPSTKVIKRVMKMARRGGGIFLIGDYSQLEVFIAAALSQEKGLLEAFYKGWDIHAYAASQVFAECKGIDLDIIKRDFSSQRSAAKAVIFGLLYGKTPTSPEMETVYKYFFEGFPKLALWIEDQHRLVRAEGKVTTPFGRTRFLPDGMLPDNSRNIWDIRAAERRSVNTPIQSTASDVAITACVEIDEYYTSNHLYSKLIGGVHDSILNDIYPGELGRVIPEIHRITTDLKYDFLDGAVLKFDLSIGESWGRVLDIDSFERNGDYLDITVTGGEHDFKCLKHQLMIGYPGLEIGNIEPILDKDGTIQLLKAPNDWVRHSKFNVRADLRVPIHSPWR